MNGPNAKPLRICMMIPKLAMGGAEVQVLELMKHLDRSRFAVSLCLMKRGDAAMESEAARNVESLFHLDFRWRKAPFTFARLVSRLRRERFDILHAHLPHADTVGRVAAWTAGVPVRVTTEHGRMVWKRGAYLILERALSIITDVRICVSRDILEIRARREGTPRSKLVYIPNAIDTAAFRCPARPRAEVMREFGWQGADPLVVSVGRLVAEKNYPLLVDAFAIIREANPSVRLLIAGEGDSRREIEERISARALGVSAALPGARSDIPDLLAAADIFVLSSTKEGLPVSLLEAMAAGKATVATAVGGIPEAIRNGENGVLVPPGDAAALAGAMKTLLADVEARRMYGERARADAEREYDIMAVAARIGDLYESLVRAHAARGRRE